MTQTSEKVVIYFALRHKAFGYLRAVFLKDSLTWTPFRPKMQQQLNNK